MQRTCQAIQEIRLVINVISTIGAAEEHLGILPPHAEAFAGRAIGLLLMPTTGVIRQ